VILDLGPNKLRLGALSAKPAALFGTQARNDLATIAEIDLIENGDPAARADWQGRQFVNLLRHARERSAFWRKRIIGSSLTAGSLKFLPVLTRVELADQVAREGSLMPVAAGDAQLRGATGESTGTPVTVHFMPQNIRYNSLRSLAQFFMERRDFRLNRVQLQLVVGPSTSGGKPLTVERTEGWLGSFDQLFLSGHNKQIRYAVGGVTDLVQELLKDPVGYLVCSGADVDTLLNHGGAELFRQMQVRHWIHNLDSQDEERNRLLSACGITIRAIYSSAEVGPIGYECAMPFHYHLTHSNVIVEVDQAGAHDVDGKRLHPILVTHLHSYATPVLRYDVGDLGTLLQSCPCGHRGPTLTNVRNRRKLQPSDG
jgi:phenylacetate-CoA ligase